jgi:hypothetical protein
MTKALSNTSALAAIIMVILDAYTPKTSVDTKPATRKASTAQVVKLEIPSAVLFKSGAQRY